MKNLTIEQVEKFIKNAILLEDFGSYRQYKHAYPDRANNTFDLIGWPNLISVENFNNYIQSNPTFPKHLLNIYKIKSERNYYNQYGANADFYIIPFKLDTIDYLNNSKNENIIKKWSELVDLYVQNNQEFSYYSDLESQLLQTSIELYTDNMLLTKSKLTNVTSADFITAYIRGYNYRKNFDSHIKKTSFFNVSLEDFYQTIANLAEDKTDLVLLEQAILSSYGYKNIYFNKIQQSHIDLTKQVKTKYFKDGPIDIKTPFLNYFREMNLYDHQSEKRAAQTMIDNLEKLKMWTFDVVKEDFLFFYNSSKKKPVVNYALSVLEENNAVPSTLQTLLENKTEVIYRNSLAYNLNSIKNMIENSLYGTITLLKIVEKSYMKDEIFQNLILFIEEDKGIATFILEDKNEDNLKINSEKLTYYVNAALNDSFLTVETKKKITKHNVHRVAYEGKEDIMTNFTYIKDKFLAKESLEKSLNYSDDKPKKTKKI